MGEVDSRKWWNVEAGGDMKGWPGLNFPAALSPLHR